MTSHVDSENPSHILFKKFFFNWNVYWDSWDSYAVIKYTEIPSTLYPVSTPPPANLQNCSIAQSGYWQYTHLIQISPVLIELIYACVCVSSSIICGHLCILYHSQGTKHMLPFYNLPPPSQLPSSLLVNHSSVLYFNNFVILKCYINQIIYYVTFGDLHFSLSMNYLEIHPSCYVYWCFVLFYFWVVFHDVYVTQFNHLPARGHLRCFQLLAIMSKTAVNVHVQVLCEHV